MTSNGMDCVAVAAEDGRTHHEAKEHAVHLEPHRGRDLIDYLKLSYRVTEGLGSALDLATQSTVSPRVVRALQTKAAVGGMGTADEGAGLLDRRDIVAEFLALARPLTIRGKLESLARRVPFNLKVARTTTGGSGAWVGQGAAIPVSQQVFDRTFLPRLKLASLAVSSAELFEDSSPRASEAIAADLRAAIIKADDEHFLSDATAVAGVSPAGITAGVTPITSSGNSADDVETLVDGFAGDLTTSVLLMTPKTGTSIGLRAPLLDIGARGGQVVGLPVITSESIPTDSTGARIILLDAGALLYADEGEGDVEFSEYTTVEMDSEPTADSLTPATSSALVSMFQAGSVAVKVTRWLNYSLGRAGAVAVVDGVDYSTAS